MRLLLFAKKILLYKCNLSHFSFTWVFFWKILLFFSGILKAIRRRDILKWTYL